MTRSKNGSIASHAAEPSALAEERYLTLAEAERIAGVSRGTLYNLMKPGGPVRFAKIGTKSRRIVQSSLLAYLRSCEVTP
jgi:predicted DNA-binding transcriptional regulator AlpA